MGPVSQSCGTLKNPCDYMEVGSKAKFVGHFSPELSSANRAPRSSGSGLYRGLHTRAAWVPLELKEETKRSGAQRASVIQA
jgi:hypothetical protein